MTKRTTKTTLTLIALLSVQGAVAQTVQYVAAYSPVPQFLIEEALQDKGESRIHQKPQNSTVSNDVLVTSTTDMPTAVVEEKVIVAEDLGEKEAKVEKKVVPHAKPKLWYGGPWRRG